MTKEDIIKTIVVALIGALSKSFFDNILGKYIPDKNKLNSYIKNVLLFSLRYLSPMLFLILSFIDNNSIDKFFIFKVSILTSVLVFNILFDMFSYITEKQISLHRQNLELHKESMESTKKLELLVDNLFNIVQKNIELRNKTDKSKSK